MTRGSIALAAVLLILWAVTHYAYDHLAAAFGSTGARWYYVLCGVERLALGLLVALACRSWLPRLMALGLCWEGLLQAGCGGARLYDPREWFAAPGEGICDALGVHVYWLGLFLVAIMAALLHWRHDDG